MNFDKVTDRVLRGLYTGAGVVVSDNVDDFISSQAGMSDTVTSVAAAGIGLGISVFADEATDMVGMRRNGPVNDMMEFAGYGIQGAAFNNLFESFTVNTSSVGQAVPVSKTRTSPTHSSGGVQHTQTRQRQDDDDIMIESP